MAGKGHSSAAEVFERVRVVSSTLHICCALNCGQSCLLHSVREVNQIAARERHILREADGTALAEVPSRATDSGRPGTIAFQGIGPGPSTEERAMNNCR